MIHIKKKTGVLYKKTRIYELMKEWGFSVKRPRMQTNKSDPQEQEKFLDNFQTLMVLLFFLSKISGKNTKVLFTDEASFRRDGTIHNGWFKKGVIPQISESNGRFESIKLIGAVDYQEGSFHLKKASGKITTEVYADFLEHLSNLHEDKLLVIVHDNAPWHGVKKLPKLLAERGIENIIIIRLPKYSPEMNYCEKLWMWMRESVTHCRYYETVKELDKSIWRFYRRAYNQRKKARIRFKTEKPLFCISVKNYRKGFIQFLWWFIAIKIHCH